MLAHPWWIWPSDGPADPIFCHNILLCRCGDGEKDSQWAYFCVSVPIWFFSTIWVNYSCFHNIVLIHQVLALNTSFLNLCWPLFGGHDFWRHGTKFRFYSSEITLGNIQQSKPLCSPHILTGIMISSKSHSSPHHITPFSFQWKQENLFMTNYTSEKTYLYDVGGQHNLRFYRLRPNPLF